MEQPFIYDPSEPLNHIKKVEATPFMLTRIMQKVSGAYQQRVTPTVAWVGSLALILVIVLNVWAISTNSVKAHHNSQLQSLAFYPNNSLYE